MLAIEELTSRISSAAISAVLKRLESGFDPDLDTSGRRRAIRADISDALKAKRPPHPLTERFYGRVRAGAVPVDVVLATSMLQVGVDVSRFGLMVVTGQPKKHCRVYPGVVPGRQDDQATRARCHLVQLVAAA